MWCVVCVVVCGVCGVCGVCVVCDLQVCVLYPVFRANYVNGNELQNYILNVTVPGLALMCVMCVCDKPLYHKCNSC